MISSKLNALNPKQSPSNPPVEPESIIKLMYSLTGLQIDCQLYYAYDALTKKVKESIKLLTKLWISRIHVKMDMKDRYIFMCPEKHLFELSFSCHTRSVRTYGDLFVRFLDNNLRAYYTTEHQFHLDTSKVIHLVSEGCN